MRLKISTGEFCLGAVGVMAVRVDIRILHLRRMEMETRMEHGS